MADSETAAGITIQSGTTRDTVTGSIGSKVEEEFARETEDRHADEERDRQERQADGEGEPLPKKRWPNRKNTVLPDALESDLDQSPECVAEIGHEPVRDHWNDRRLAE